MNVIQIVLLYFTLVSCITGREQYVLQMGLSDPATSEPMERHMVVSETIKRKKEKEM